MVTYRFDERLYSNVYGIISFAPGIFLYVFVRFGMFVYFCVCFGMCWYVFVFFRIFSYVGIFGPNHKKPPSMKMPQWH